MKEGLKKKLLCVHKIDTYIRNIEKKRDRVDGWVGRYGLKKISRQTLGH